MITKKYNSGFTLLETLVAIAILLIAVVGPISLIGDSLHKLYYAKDQMIAINLAQEGLEVFRWKRDTNMLKINAGTLGVNWNDGIIAGSYLVSSYTKEIISTTAITPQVVNTTSQYGQYTQRSGTATQFKRIIVVSDVSLNEKQVASTVTWTTGGQSGTITVTEHIFKWAVP